MSPAFVVSATKQLLSWAGIFALATVAWPASAQLPVEDSLSVCEALASATKYRNRTVVVTGELRVGRHVAALIQDDCQFSRPRRVPAICITLAGNFDAPKVPYSANTAILRAVLQLQRMLGDLDAGYRSSASLEGQLFSEDDDRGGVGFCHLNGYSVLMVVKDIRRYSLWSGGTDVERPNARLSQPATRNSGRRGEEKGIW